MFFLQKFLSDTAGLSYLPLIKTSIRFNWFMGPFLKEKFCCEVFCQRGVSQKLPTIFLAL